MTPSGTPGIDFDATTLRAAVLAANASIVADTIQLPAGTYTLNLTGANEDAAASGDLDVTNNLTIVGAGVATLIDGNLTDRVFHVFGGATLNLSSLTIQNGRAQPGDSLPSAGSLDSFGGGIANFGTLVLDACVVTGNQANGGDDRFAGQGFGGGIYHDGTSITVRNSLVSGNQATGGNAVGPPGTFAFAGGGVGGGIFINAGTVDLTDSILAGNQAQGGQASIGTGGFGGEGDGGGLAAFDGTITIQRTTLRDNQAVGGVGDSNGSGNGGGIFNFAPQLDINNTTLSNNLADNGAGIFNSGTQTLTNTTISGNRARNDGGGILERVGETTNLINATLTANVADADADGGGDGGGVFTDFFGTVRVQSTILAGNFDSSTGPNTNANPDVSGTFVSLGNNLLGNGTGGTGFTDNLLGDQVGTAAMPLNPLLGPLANNGGTTFTHALLFGSPAIDRGANPLNRANDQRGPGFLRTAGAGTDVGAYEFQGPPDLAVAKDDLLTTVVPGQTITYTLTVSNLSLQIATGVMARDVLPASTTFVSASDGGTLVNDTVTWNLGTLGIGATVMRTVTVMVNPAVPAGVNTLTNTALVRDDGSNGPDPTPANNTAADTDTLAATPDLTLAKDDGLTTVSPGQTVTYTLTIRNVGNQDATGVVVTDTLPANTTFVSATGNFSVANGIVTFNLGTLNAGQSATFLLVVQVNNLLPAGVTAIVNTATVADDGSNGPDPTPGNNITSDRDDVAAAPDLTILKDDGLSTVAPGQQITYTLTIANVGNQEATGVVALDSLPANTNFVSASDGGTLSGGVVMWGIGAVAAGQQVTRTVTVQVTNPVAAGVNTLTNTALVRDDGSNGPDPTPANNTATDTDTLAATPDLTLAKDDGLTTVTPGQTVPYTLTIRNVGNQDATGVVVTDTLPVNTTFVSASDGGTLANGIVTWNVGPLPVGGSVTRTVTVQVNNVASAVNGSLLNTAIVADDGANGADPTPGNNSAADATSLRTSQPTGFGQATVGPPLSSPPPAVLPTVVSKVFLLGSTIGQNLTGDLAGPTAYVNSLYHQLLNRAPTVDEVNYWVFQLQAGVDRLQVAAQIYESAEHRALQVDRFYQAFLHRDADSGGRAYWVNIFLSGASETEVAYLFITSGEYQANHADTGAFVTGLYLDVLGRVPELREVAYWTQLLENGASRSEIAYAFVTSAEAQHQLVILYYRAFLGRAADEAEVQYWLALLQNRSLSPTTAAEMFLTSDEFYSQPR